ncbi:DUF11 domain-containing protein [Paenibacillus sp. Mc5Re-14]|uniref:DUF11 domain-containing protein n=1 Tax=Paenibacillus sp. Mc5Re-14 TaxID=1030529 RepID=UPI000AD15B46|nr:DUF11 domain-containing protein [Paenibacillus sp. Mc5Re-14]
MVIQGGAGVSSATGSVNVVISGFATPVQGTLRGRALISAQEGDVDITGDRALFGPTTSNLTALSGPNNFSTNFFASQINGDDGTLVTTGTFGTTNTVNVAVSAPNIQVTKTSSLAAAVVGDTIRYTLSITNNGVDSVTDTVVTDTIPAGTSFVPGSVLIDGVPFPNASPTAGIAIGNVAPGNTFIVSFQTSVQSLPQTSPQTIRRPKQGKT